MLRQCETASTVLECLTTFRNRCEGIRRASDKAERFFEIVNIYHQIASFQSVAFNASHQEKWINCVHCLYFRNLYVLAVFLFSSCTFLSLSTPNFSLYLPPSLLLTDTHDILVHLNHTQIYIYIYIYISYLSVYIRGASNKS